MSELHRCHRGPRCVDRESDPDTPAIKRGAQINASEGLCDACTRLVAQAIECLPQDYFELQAEIASRRNGHRELVTGTREPPAPISLTIAALQSELLHEAQCWAESVAEVLRIDWDTQAARDSRPAAVLFRASDVLGTALPVLVSLRGVQHVGWVDDEWTILERDGLDGAVLLVELHRRAQILTGQQRLVHRLPAPCPRCERLALTRDDGDEVIACSACGRVYTWEEYQGLCGLLAATPGVVA